MITVLPGIGLRLLCAVQLIAFYSLLRDIRGMAGARGIQPVHEVLAAYRRDYGWKRFLYAPSLLHFGSSDRTLVSLLGVGIGASVVAAVGGPWSPFAFFIAWAIYLSFDVAIDLLYPWDSLLLEAGFLACFVPSLSLLPDIAIRAAPHPVVIWAFRLLAFRVVFGFGKYKFFGPGRLDTGYLKSFLVTQPMPRRLGLRLQRLPLPFHQASLLVLFGIEVLCPWLWLGPPAYRPVASVAVCALMLGIQLTGNFGFFNLATIAVAIIAATPSQSAFDLSFGRPEMPWDAPHVLGITLLVAALCHFPFHSWVSRSWIYWPDLERRLPRATRPLLRVLRALAPFRLVHAYGVFGPECGPAGQWVPRFEGSVDGERWELLPYRHYPSDQSFVGVSVAPFFPRFDHSVIYEAMGLGVGNLMSGLVGGGRPYRASRALFFERVQRRLLEGSPEVVALFGPSPFPARTPAFYRVSFRFQRLNEDAERVAFEVMPLGEHLPARRLDDCEPFTLPGPAGFMPDDRVWTARARLPPCSRVRDVVEAFAELPSTTKQALELGEIERDRMRDVEASLFRVAWSHREAMAPERTESEFELWLCSLRLATLDGGERTDREQLAVEGLRVLAMLRPRWIRFHARKARMTSATLRGAARRPPSFAPGILRWTERLSEFDFDSSTLPRFERRGPRGLTLVTPTPAP
jgi:Lipase maturation factor